ncbi:hypothetical protein SDC9_124645 [bioreactor metagenome]|uniref:Uncharacterized protein n=1 Tax=bioreactor metagenome TaxID=1076179 RepID=A0A645CL59_9ZZZZ
MIHRHRQHDRQGKTRQKAVEAEAQRVEHRGFKLKGVEKFRKIRVPGVKPGAAQYPGGVPVVFKRDDHAVHGLVGENDEQDDGRGKQEIQPRVLLYIAPGAPRPGPAGCCQWAFSHRDKLLHHCYR